MRRLIASTALALLSLAACSPGGTFQAEIESVNSAGVCAIPDDPGDGARVCLALSENQLSEASVGDCIELAESHPGVDFSRFVDCAG